MTEARQDTATEDAAKIAAERTAIIVPEVLAARGFEAMPFGVGNLWGVDEDAYLYKPLRAWDAAQQLVDDVVARTGGSVYTLVSAMMETMAGVAAIGREVDETEDAANRIRGLAWLRMSQQNWSGFLAACPSFKPAEFAKQMIVRCSVHRLPSEAEQAKSDADPTKDHGGLLFDVRGAGSVDAFYRGRRHQLVRIGLAAFWGSCGDFFGGR